MRSAADSTARTPMTWPGLQVVRRFWELAVVAAAAVLGLTVQAPLEQVVRHQGIDVLLVILVFSTAISIEPQSLRRLPAAWKQLSLALVVGVSVLPILSWLVSHVVAPGHLRDGITTIGLAPCEIASIATTAMAGGEIALAGGILIGSTVLTVSVAGPILALETPGATFHPEHIVLNLLVIVAVPLALGVALRSLIDIPPRGEVAASTTSTLSVAALVALIAAEVHLSSRYLPVLSAVLMFLIASVVIGRAIGHRSGPSTRKALLLTTSMRDFAIAAALAASAFGPAAAAPLGVYGVTVLIWGTASAGFMRARHSTLEPPT
jgi:predicted Na+-dependent transporter